MLNFPDICNHDDTTVVACHSNQQIHGKATSLKANDCFFTFGCFECHAELDSGKQYSREDKVYFFERGMAKTWLYLWESGKIQVCDDTGG